MKKIITILLVLFIVYASYSQNLNTDKNHMVVGLTTELSNSSHIKESTDAINSNSETSQCYQTTEYLFVDDYEDASYVESGKSITYVASHTIIFSDGFIAEEGSYVHAFIVEDYCPTLSESILSNNFNDLSSDFNDTNVVDDQQSVFDESDLLMYPNPTNDKLNINFLNQTLSDAEILLLDSKGQIMKNFNSQNNNLIEIDMTNLPDGTYLIVIQNAAQVIKRKIVKL